MYLEINYIILFYNLYLKHCFVTTNTLWISFEMHTQSYAVFMWRTCQCCLILTKTGVDWQTLGKLYNMKINQSAELLHAHRHAEGTKSISVAGCCKHTNNYISYDSLYYTTVTFLGLIHKYAYLYRYK
jgi:hypothetical protein